MDKITEVATKTTVIIVAIAFIILVIILALGMIALSLWGLLFVLSGIQSVWTFLFGARINVFGMI